MAELTNLETKLGEVIGLAMAAQAATERVEKLTKDAKLRKQLKTMRQEAALQAVPVLLVTPSASKEHVVLAARVQANGYIVRPLTRSALEDKVCSILGLPSEPGRPRATFSAIAHRAAR